MQSVAFFEPAFGFVANSLRILSLKAVRDEASGVVLRLVIVVVMMVFVACVRVLCVCVVFVRVCCVCVVSSQIPGRTISPKRTLSFKGEFQKEQSEESFFLGAKRTASFWGQRCFRVSSQTDAVPWGKWSWEGLPQKDVVPLGRMTPFEALVSGVCGGDGVCGFFPSGNVIYLIRSGKGPR